MSSKKKKEVKVKKTKEKKQKKKKDFRGVILFIVVFAIGSLIGVFGTRYIKDKIDDENKKGDPVVKEIDITKKSEYQNIINDLYSRLKGYPEYYAVSGIKTEDMSNDFKYKILYDDVKTREKYTKETLTADWGAFTCPYSFMIDVAATGTTQGTCNVEKIKRSELEKSYKNLFAVGNLEGNPVFYLETYKYCVPVEDYYLCGNISAPTNEGSLDTRFSITKVIKDNEGNIYIYDKGYLVDNRISVPKVEGVTTYYLHSSDASEYYYELKSSENLTFKHTFKVDDEDNYYYSSSEVVE